METIDYVNQVEIPEGKVNDYEIVHMTKPAGTVLDTGTSRTSIVGGQPSEPVVFEDETKWHVLKYDGGTWMTDLPIEQKQHRECLQNMYGHVLVGGLGLGLAVNWLAAMDEVDEITVIEKSPEVIKLVSKHIKNPDNKPIHFVKADLLKWLERAHKKEDKWFNSAFYDIWQADSENTFFNIVVPLRKFSVGVVDDSPVCWNEDVMRGQLYFGLMSRYQFVSESTPDDFRQGKSREEALDDLCNADCKWRGWSAPFFQAVRDGIINDTNFSDAHVIYVQLYGMPHAESIWESMVARKDFKV